MYAVIMAGGGGTRLWPLSRPETPKPFLPLLGERSLLQRTVDRIVGHEELGLAPDDVAVVTERRYGPMVREQLPGVRVIAEPIGRNTAAAIALSTLKFERDPAEVMLVLPADAWIDPERDGVYRSVLKAAASIARDGAFEVEAPLMTLGIRPNHPATEYGYLIPNYDAGATIDGIKAYPLHGFEEKPNHERAGQLYAQLGVAWNAGIFLWQRRAIRDAIERYTGLMTMIGTVAGSETGLQAAYDRLKPLSIDRAVMESTASDRRVAMAAMDVGWSDLGSWTQLIAAVGGGGSGRVVPPNEAAHAEAGDLVVERQAGVLAVTTGPRDILAPSPVALLTGAAAHREPVEALISRVAAWELLQ
ncbi:MAG TPA: sugar phosphate nucleotidyltransferase [Patescibacteria group bacterium]|nr:sugar phosphate nucleotidyltransferase [Patescibacteria group bacterium]